MKGEIVINMKNTKKITILLLILASLFLITCGKDEKKDDTENKKEDKVEANVSTNLSEEELKKFELPKDKSVANF